MIEYKKCKVIKFNSIDRNHWVFCNYVLKVVEQYEILGLEVSKEGLGGDRQRKITEGKVRKMSGMVINGGAGVVNKFEVGRSLWKGVAVLYCLYRSANPLSWPSLYVYTQMRIIFFLYVLGSHCSPDVQYSHK